MIDGERGCQRWERLRKTDRLTEMEEMERERLSNMGVALRERYVDRDERAEREVAKDGSGSEREVDGEQRERLPKMVVALRERGRRRAEREVAKYGSGSERERSTESRERGCQIW